jgi:tetratricopeptide (TPR) repeat protein
MQIGLENDLIDDYLELADVLLQHEEIEEAIRLYSHVMSLDPENVEAKDKLSETRNRYKIKGKDQEGEGEKEEISLSKEEGDEDIETASRKTSLQETIDNYKNILSVNPSNANVRCKLAEAYIQLDKTDDAIHEWDKASETFIFKGELDKGIALCEKVLELKPTEGNIRDRLSKALLQKDSFKAIESAISAYTDTFEKQMNDDTGNNEESDDKSDD